MGGAAVAGLAGTRVAASAVVCESQTPASRPTSTSEKEPRKSERPLTFTEARKAEGAKGAKRQSERGGEAFTQGWWPILGESPLRGSWRTRLGLGPVRLPARVL